MLAKKLLVDVKNRGTTKSGVGGNYAGKYPIVVDNNAEIISLDTTEFSAKFNTIDQSISQMNTSISSKQNKLIAGNNIEINNNIITAVVPDVDLSEYQKALKKTGGFDGYLGLDYETIENKLGHRWIFGSFNSNGEIKSRSYIDVYTKQTNSAINIFNAYDTTYINNLEKNINNNINLKQNIISAGDGISLLNNVISIQQTLLDKWNNYQTLIQNNDTKIATNTDEIDTLQNDLKEINKLIQQIIEGLQKFPVFEIVGDWANGTTYRKNQAVYHNNKLWNSKVDNNNKEPNEQNVDSWYLISNFDIPLNEYLTKVEAQDLLRTKQDILSGTNGVVVNQTNNQVSIDNTLTTKWNGYETLIQSNQNEINKTNSKVNNISDEQELMKVDIQENSGLIDSNKQEIENLKQSKQDILNNNTKDIYPKKINFGDDITLYKYSNNEMVATYGNKLSFYSANNKRITFNSNGEIVGYQKTLDTPEKERNNTLTSYTPTGRFIGGKEVYEGFITGSFNGLTYLFNSFTHLLLITIYDKKNNKYLNPESVGLKKYANSTQLGATFPNGEYYIYFQATRN